MQVTVNISSTAEKILDDLAARKGKSAIEIAANLLEEKLLESQSFSAPLEEPDEDTDPQALEKAIAELLNRRPEEIQATRNQILAMSRPPRPLPEGKSLIDVISGQWPGTESDEEVYAALAKLS